MTIWASGETWREERRAVEVGLPDALLNAQPIWTVWFILCLFPVSIGDGFSANYLFVLTALFFVSVGWRVRRVPPSLTVLACLSLAVLALSTVLVPEFLPYSFRRAVSFLLFLAPMTWAVFDLPPRVKGSFLLAVVAVSIFLSTKSILLAVTSGVTDPATLKSIVGNQRVGFLYLFALWTLVCLIRLEYSASWIRGAAGLGGAIILGGLVATFSRSSVVALIGGPSVYVLYYLLRGTWRWRDLRTGVWLIAGTLVSTILIASVFPQFFEFVDSRILGLWRDEQFASVADPETSEGTRVAIWALVLDFVKQNPLTGSGFLGSWVLADFAGSSHNEYIDRLMRLGVVGFLSYSYVMWRIWDFLFRRDGYMSAAFASISVYGLFHETWSQSHGAALLAFLISMYSEDWRRAQRSKSETIDPSHAGA